MGPKIKTNVSLQNEIIALVNSGTFDGPIADRYREKKLVMATTQKAEEGDPEAMQSLGEWYRDGANGLPEDESQSKKWLTEAEDARDIHNLRKEAEDGDSEAQNKLGKMYLLGRGIQKNSTQAAKWFKKSSDQKNIRGIANYGVCVAHGWGCEQNITHCSVLTATAAGMGCDSACYNLGLWYRSGDNGLPKDEKESIYWLRKSYGDSCNVKILPDNLKAAARRMVSELEQTEAGVA